jgi:DNA-binding LytR/AlgR family response regulator
MNIAICEDDDIFAARLQEALEVFFRSKKIQIQVHIYTDGKHLLRDYTLAGAFDALFVDINLNSEEDGVAIVAQIRRVDPKVPVIFVTSLEHRAIDGYDVDAFGFVVKRTVAQKLPALLEKLYEQLYVKETLLVSERERMVCVELSDILSVESEGRGTCVHTKQETLHDTRSITAFAKLLPEADFVETYKSVYARVTGIQSVNEDTITMVGGMALPVSRRNRKNVMMAIMRKVGNHVS